MDLRLEAAALSEMAENTKNDPEFRVPAVDWDLHRARRAHARMDRRARRSTIARGSIAKGFDLKVLARAVIQTFLRHALRDGFFHADMHPGNLFVDDAGNLVAVDFGIMGRLGPKERRFLAEILYGFITRDYQRTAEVHFEAGYVPRHHSVESFAQAIRAIGEPIHNRTAEEISMAKLLMLLFEVTGLFDMRTRPELLLLQKTMVVVEGVARGLDPKLDMWKVAEPVVREWIERHLGPAGRLEGAAEGAREVGRFLGDVPGLLSRAAGLVEQLDTITRDGLVLAPETVAAIGRAEARRNRWTDAGTMGDRGAARGADLRAGAVADEAVNLAINQPPKTTGRTSMINRRALTAIAALGLACVQMPAASAQDWPTKPVRILIGFGAGGGTDVATRIVADGLSEILGQQFVVENRPGAGGTIAGGVVAKAAKDGYTALAISMGHSVSAVMVKQVPYDPVNDFAPVGIFTNSAFVLAVPKDSPATDLKSLVAYVNKNPGKLNYSTVGLGSTQHLIAEDLRQRTGMNAQAVSYRTTGEVVSALLRGDAAFAVELYHAIRGQVDSGALRLLVVGTPMRWPGLANVPTVAESGIAGFGFLGWYGLVFPAGTPQPIVDKMHKSLKEVLGREAVRKRLEGVGAIANLSTPEEFRKVIESDIKGFREVAGKAGLEAQ